MSNSQDRHWTSSPLVAILGLIASLLGIYAFFSGNENLGETLAIATPTEHKIINSSDYTVLPTEIINPIPTKIPQELLVSLSKPLKEFLPDSSEITNGMKVSEETVTTNEDIAKLRDDPVQILQQINEWGRVSGYWKSYLNQDGCEAKTGLRELTMQTVLFFTSKGAQNAYLFYNQEQKETLEIDRFESAPSVGDQNELIYFSDGESDCETPEQLQCISINFTRANVLGSVYACSLKNENSENELKQEILRLAKIMDLNIFASTSQ